MTKSQLAALWIQIHDEACGNGQEFYRDPKTGEQVSTRIRLQRLKKCCKSGCRHCPYGFKKRK
ncbi:MAG: DUF5522 domain-containing protein [Oligoflexia bacterium]|nr:DUF5522 domain-containing protein [Oligoflexia bacterium]